MSTQSTKLQRWLDLIAYLVGHRRAVVVDSIMEYVPAYAEKWKTGKGTDKAAVRRMFERDKSELAEQGIPIRYTEERHEVSASGEPGYILDKSEFYLPF